MYNPVGLRRKLNKKPKDTNAPNHEHDAERVKRVLEVWHTIRYIPLDGSY